MPQDRGPYGPLDLRAGQVGPAEEVGQEGADVLSRSGFPRHRRSVQGQAAQPVCLLEPCGDLRQPAGEVAVAGLRLALQLPEQPVRGDAVQTAAQEDHVVLA